MVVERSSYTHKHMKFAQVTALLAYIIATIILYNSEGRILILPFWILGLAVYYAFSIAEQYDRLNRPIIYNINSENIKLVYYSKKVKSFKFESIKNINIVITEVDHIELEFVDDNDNLARMYSDDFEDFPNVFYSFIKLAKNAEVSKLSSYIRRSKLRSELVDDRDILEILKEKEQIFKREKLNPWRIKF